MHRFIIQSAAILAATLLAGCREELDVALTEPPPAYSSDYTYIDVVSENGKVKRVLVPEACLTENNSYSANLGLSRLPPGCANNYNLQRMAERKGDLLHGRPLGPAPAAPAASAARRYINNRGEVRGGAVNPENQPGSPTNQTYTSGQ